jgi:hypothetical protein
MQDERRLSDGLQAFGCWLDAKRSRAREFLVLPTWAPLTNVASWSGSRGKRCLLSQQIKKNKKQRQYLSRVSIDSLNLAIAECLNAAHKAVKDLVMLSQRK